MSESRFVLLSSGEGAEVWARSHPGCILVSLVGDELRAIGGDVISDRSGAIKLPGKRLLLRQYLRSDLTGWLKAIDWLRDLARLIIVDYEHPLRELMLLARARGALAYGLLMHSKIGRIAALDYALLGAADLLVFEDQEIEATFKKLYVGCYHPLIQDDRFAEHLQEIQAQRASPTKQCKSVSATTREAASTATKRLLLISYFSGPCRTVGVQRVNYWAEQIETLSEGAFEVHLATAIDWGDADTKVHYVPDLHLASILGIDEAFPGWATPFNETEVRDAKCFNTLSYYWRYALEAYFDRLDLSFDAVLISGNPFAVFDFGAYAKRRWHARVLLDYRDPFANNPRMRYAEAARQHARYIEKGYNLQADLALVVNDDCLRYIESPEDIPAVIIPNGFDERALDGIEPPPLPGDAIKLVHAGSLYYDRSPRALLTSIKPGQHELHHVGSLSGIDEDLLNAAGLITYGRRSYAETLEIIGGGDCGIVYVSATGFETTTKVYDYLALGLDILICTHGDLYKGALASILGDYPGLYWCRNDEAGIRGFLASYQPTRNRSKGDMAYSRRRAAEKLIRTLQDLLP